MTNGEAVSLLMNSQYYERGYKQGVSDVVGKIRAEIEEPLKINQGLNTDSAKAQTIALSWVLEVIDKYKGESENP